MSGHAAGTNGRRTGRRYVVAMGTGTYTDEALCELPGVPSDVASVLATLGSVRHRPYESAIFPDGLVDPILPSDVLGPLNDWLSDPVGRGDDTVIVYYSGHGLSTDRLYLTVKDSRSLNPVGTAIPVDDLIRCFYQGGATRLLLIVDTCYAALGGIEAMRTTAALEGSARSEDESALVRQALEARVQDASRNAAHKLSGAPGADRRDLLSYAVITAARGQAQDSAFSAALARALAPRIPDSVVTAHLQPYLRVQDVVDRINSDFAAQQLMQRASAHIGIYSGSSSDLAEDFLPNPDYRPGLPPGLDRAEQQTWISSAAREFFTQRGTATDGDRPAQVPFDRFHGRGRVLTDIVAWLRTPAGTAVPQVTVVTGSSGIGKSAVLGRLVTRADPPTRHLISDAALTVAADLPAAIFNVVIHARHTSLNQVTDDLARALGLPPDQGTEALVQALAQRAKETRPLTVVVDALDEAGSATGDKDPQEQGALIADYLSNLVARTSHLRLLVGTRRHLLSWFDQLGDRRRVIDLDDPQWTTHDDLTTYAAHLLQHPHGPGSTTEYTPAAAHRVGNEIAERAFPNFLITRLAARALAANPLPHAELWEGFPSADQPDSVVSAFRWALATQLGDTHPHIRDLLRPLAYAEGVGLPLSVWPALAAAFLGRPVSDSELADALGSHAAGAYVVEALDEGHSVFRLYHQALAEDLRLDAPADTQQRIADALADCVPPATGGGRDWEAADPYVRRHLPTHADLAGQIYRFLSDPQFPRVDVCPYPGLAAFREDEAPLFFGRNDLIKNILVNIDEQASSGGFLLLVGPSGVGKSSLISAGVTASVRRGEIPGSSHWPTFAITPTAEPVRSLAHALERVTHLPVSQMAALLSAGPTAVAQTVRDLLRNRHGDEQHTPLLLVVDQFEELFTYCSDEQERQTFLDLLTSLAAPAPQPAALVVLALRADFYAYALSYPQLRDTLANRQIPVGPMSETQMREAIVEPARSVGLELEPGLTERLLRDMGTGVRDDFASDQGMSLPLLAHALRTIWFQRREMTLTLNSYMATGGVASMVATSAEGVFARLDAPQRAAARTVFLRLISIGSGSDVASRRWPRAALLSSSADAAETAYVINQFAQVGLLSVSADSVQITHDALLYAWPRLRHWIEGDREAHRIRQHIEEAARAWLDHGREPDLLVRGSILADAEFLMATHDDPFPDNITSEFLILSKRQRKRGQTYRRLAAAALAALTAIAVVEAVVIFWLRN